MGQRPARSSGRLSRLLVVTLRRSGDVIALLEEACWMERASTGDAVGASAAGSRSEGGRRRRRAIRLSGTLNREPRLTFVATSSSKRTPCCPRCCGRSRSRVAKGSGSLNDRRVGDSRPPAKDRRSSGGTERPTSRLGSISAVSLGNPRSVSSPQKPDVGIRRKAPSGAEGHRLPFRGPRA